MSCCRSWMLMLTLTIASTTGAAGQIAIGTMGHSLTDEYQRPQSTRQFGLEGFNWLEILARTRSAEVDFGPYEATLDAYGEPGGYAFNHAIGGAMVLYSNMPQQLAELVGDVQAGQIDAVVIWIGSLDFSVRMWNGGSFALDDPSFQSFQADFVAALVDALDTLIDAGASDILLAIVGPADPNRADIVLATDDTNDKLAAAVALRPEVTFFDPLSELKSRFDAASQTVRIGTFGAGGVAPSSDLVDPPGGVTPTQCGFNEATKAPGCPTAAYQAHVLQDDGAHLTTPMQGLVANGVIAALQSRGSSLTPLTDAEILEVSGVVAPPPQTGSLALRWSSLVSKCRASSAVCRLKGKLLARNTGAAPSDPVPLSYLLSEDASADAGDLVVRTGAVPSLRPGKQKKLKLKVTLPAGVSTSGRYLIVEPSVGPAMVQGPLN